MLTAYHILTSTQRAGISLLIILTRVGSFKTSSSQTHGSVRPEFVMISFVSSPKGLVDDFETVIAGLLKLSSGDFSKQLLTHKWPKPTVYR